MMYLFKCEKCNVEHMLSFSMKDDDGRENAKCPDCNEKLKRVWTVPMIRTSKSSEVKSDRGTSFIHNNEKVSFGFVNHEERDGLQNNSVGKKMKGVRVDEKTGQLVVDVVSNVRDPLGKLESYKKETIKKNINQKVKIRK